jgi:hypothetical protein
MLRFGTLGDRRTPPGDRVRKNGSMKRLGN